MHVASCLVRLGAGLLTRSHDPSHVIFRRRSSNRPKGHDTRRATRRIIPQGNHASRLMKRSHILLALLLASCEGFDYTASTDSHGNKFEHMHMNSLGGSQTTETAGGTRHTGNYNKSFGQGAQAVTAIAGGITNVAGAKVTEGTVRLKDTNATKLGITNSNNKAATDQLDITTKGANEALKIQKEP